MANSTVPNPPARPVTVMVGMLEVNTTQPQEFEKELKALCAKFNIGEVAEFETQVLGE